MDITIFYSWQSDLPPSANRNFILGALEGAAKTIRVDESIKVEPVIDRDTLGIPGSPNIAHTILEKIEKSGIFVCDVSIINPNRSLECRPTPNPNVLIELGYATKVLGYERIIMVLNQAFGAPEQLPFDLRMNRVIKYEMRESFPEKAKERNTLQKIFEKAIRQILETTSPVSPAVQIPVVDLASRLGEYSLEDVSSSDFASNLTKGLITLDASMQEITSVPAHASTIFLAVPATKLETGPSKIFKTAQEVFEKTRWYNLKSVEANAPSFRAYSSRVFPLGGTTLRIEQNSILIEDKHPGGSGRYFVLRINQQGELSFATSYYTASEGSQKNIRAFHLGAIIHLLWSFLCLVREYQEHLGYSGNYHICVAMTNTEKSFLGDFADGWPDVLKRNYIRGPEVFDEICYSSNILIRRENVNLSTFEYKVEPEILKNIAEEIARAYNQPEARCFDRNTGKLPDKLWPSDIS